MQISPKHGIIQLACCFLKENSELGEKPTSYVGVNDRRSERRRYEECKFHTSSDSAGPNSKKPTSLGNSYDCLLDMQHTRFVSVSTFPMHVP